jgi:GDP-mannose 6-dehydrogenase
MQRLLSHSFRSTNGDILKVSILGLGHVGAVSAGCLADDRREVIGIDRDRAKVDGINAGRSPFIEANIGEILASAVKSGQLCATRDAMQAVRDTDLSKYDDKGNWFYEDRH